MRVTKCLTWSSCNFFSLLNILSFRHTSILLYFRTFKYIKRKWHLLVVQDQLLAKRCGCVQTFGFRILIFSLKQGQGDLLAFSTRSALLLKMEFFSEIGYQGGTEVVWINPNLNSEHLTFCQDIFLTESINTLHSYLYKKIE